MNKIKDKKVKKTETFDQIRKNYLKMDEKGREKLGEISQKLLEIHGITKGE